LPLIFVYQLTIFSEKLNISQIILYWKKEAEMIIFIAMKFLLNMTKLIFIQGLLVFSTKGKEYPVQIGALK